jgi:hypothetical protein
MGSNYILCARKDTDRNTRKGPQHNLVGRGVVLNFFYLVVVNLPASRQGPVCTTVQSKTSAATLYYNHLSLIKTRK